MRGIGVMHPTDGLPTPPDTVLTLLIAGSSGQAMDWPAGSSVGLIARLSGQSTAGAQMNFEANLESTKAAAPSSGTSTIGTTGFGYTIMGQGTFQVPGASTGFSVASLSSGYVKIELWKKGG